MHEIDKIRSEIDQIHGDLAVLFQRRLTLTKKIWDIKKANQLSFLDQKREDEIIHRFDSSISDTDERTALQNFFKSILSESKKYLEVKLK